MAKVKIALPADCALPTSCLHVSGYRENRQVCRFVYADSGRTPSQGRARWKQEQQ